MRVVTVISDSNNIGYRNILKPSIEVNNLKLDILRINYYKNHRHKDLVLLKYINDISEDDIIFFTDGYDTLFLTDESEILAKYFKINKKLVFAAEMVCWPDASHIEKYPKTNSSFKFLNSGGFMGKAGYIKNLIMENLQTESTIKYSWSNQVYWTEQYLKNSEEIAIDTQCEIFCTMVSKEDIGIGNKFLNNIANLNMTTLHENYKAITEFHYEIEAKYKSVSKKAYYLLKKKWFNENFIIKGNRIFVAETKSYPCHIHFNGESSVLVQDVLKKIS